MSTVIINDFVRPLRMTQRSEYDDVRLARLLTLVLGALAVGIAFYVSQIDQIFKASSGFLGLFAGPVLALFLLGMLTRRAIFSGWLIGLLVAVPATFWIQHFTDVHFIYYFPFCFGVCAMTGYFASMLIGIYYGPPRVIDRKLTVWRRG